jgi:hypothetical protein
VFIYAQEPIFECKVVLRVEIFETQISGFSEEPNNRRCNNEFLLFIWAISYGFKYMNWVLSMIEWVGNALSSCRVPKNVCAFVQTFLFLLV